MTLGISISLLHGLASPAETQPRAWLRPLTGADEIRLAEAGPNEPPAARVTALLATATKRIGDAAPVTADMIRSLTVGDRQRLVLGVAAATFGPNLDVVVRCPSGACGELIELTLSVLDLVQPPLSAELRLEHELTIECAVGRRSVRFRLPNGRDEEEAAYLARSDSAAGARHLLSRCVLAIADDDNQAIAIDDDLLLELAPCIETAIGALDPAAEYTGKATCPFCGGTIRTLLDGFFLLSSELAAADRLYVEVDTMARAYHWSEAEILSLPVARRRRYLDLIGAPS
jgi:hypothetical protein